MFIDYEKIGNILGFGKDFFYNLKVKQNLNYIKNNQRKVIKKLKNKSLFNVIFYVYDESKWKSQSVYDYMLKDARFNPKIIVTKNCAPEGNANEQTVEDIKKCYKFFKSKGMNVEFGYDIEKNEFIPFEKFNPDLIFYSHPWYVYKTQGPVMCSKFALTYYIPYFIPASEQWIDYGLRFHKYVHRHYVVTELIKEFFSKHTSGENLKVVGHPILDLYNNTPDKEKKYIIYSPHWTVSGNNLRFGTFDWSGKQILEFAKKHPELNWVFRPHPLFYKFILTSGYMEKAELNKYYQDWREIGIISEGGDYLELFKESYAMITDCGSFLTEYFVTENPLIHLISEKFFGNVTVKKIDETYYCANNPEELNNYLKDVIIGKNDYKKEARLELLKELNLKNSNSAERIIRDILEEIG